jgi:hypothetical protein
MTNIVYSNKIRDPKSNSVQPHEDYFICKRIENRWHIIEGHSEITTAAQMQDKLIEYDLINGYISDPLFYRIFHRNLVEVKDSL